MKPDLFFIENGELEIQFQSLENIKHKLSTKLIKNEFFDHIIMKERYDRTKII
jgi:hypothetical protein